MHRRYQRFQGQERERFRQKNIKKVWRGVGLHHAQPPNTSILGLAAPRRKLREAKEDGIERKDGTYDLKQSSRRNKSISVNANQRTCVG